MKLFTWRTAQGVMIAIIVLATAYVAHKLEIPLAVASSMKRWRVADLMELAQAIQEAGLGSFVVRRTFQLERGEITALRAEFLIWRGKTLETL